MPTFRIIVETERRKGRLAAVRHVPLSADVLAELQQLRSWVLTRGLEVTGEQSWVVRDADIELRCPVDRLIDVMPEERVGLNKLDSSYAAVATLHHDPMSLEAVDDALREWADETGYERTGPTEFVRSSDPDATYEVVIPIRRREREDWIEITVP